MGVEDQDTASPDVSATEATLDDVTSSPAGVEGDAAESSPATQATDAKPDSLLSVVRDAVKPVADPGSSTGDEATAPAKDADAATQDNETFSDVPFHKHPRFQALVRERNELRDGNHRFGQLQSFLNENAMTGQEAAEAMNLAAQMKRDPEAAWVTLKPIVQDLLLTIGEIVPPDLRQQVNAGAITLEVAKMISKERAKANIVKGQQTFDQARQARRQQTSEEEQAAGLVRSILTSVTEWETATRGKDPDFDKKSGLLEREILFLQRRDGKPKTPETARKQLADAYRAVNDTLKAQRPAPRTIRPVIGGGTAPAAHDKPKSMLEVVRQAGGAR